MKKLSVLIAILAVLATMLAVIPNGAARAQAQDAGPENVRAVVDDEGNVHVSWDSAGAGIAYYVINWQAPQRSPSGSTQNYPRSYSTDYDARRNNPKDDTFVAGPRPSYVVRGNDGNPMPGGVESVESVRVRSVKIDDHGNEQKSAFTERVSVQAGDLTDQCKPAQPGQTNVHSKIDGLGYYRELRIPLESQVWFFPTENSEGGTATGESFGHAHLLTCVPHTVLGESGVVDTATLDLDLEIVAHLNPAKRQNNEEMKLPEVNVVVNEIEIRGRNRTAADTLVARLTASGAPFLQCSAGMTCKETINMRDGELGPINLFDANAAEKQAGFTEDGIKELRIAAVHEVYRADPQEPIASLRAILRSPIDLRLGRSTRNVADPTTETSGWLIERDRNGTGGYATIGVENWQPPVAPISADTRFGIGLHAEADPCVRNCQVDFMPLRRTWVFVNPSFHQNQPGPYTRCAGLDRRACKIERHDISLADQFPNMGDGADPCMERDRDAEPNAMRFEIPEPNAIDREVFIPVWVLRALRDANPDPNTVHRLVLSVEQPMVNGQPGTIDTNPGGGYDRGCSPSITIDDEDFQSTLSGLLVIRFMIEPE